jgi:hypothetical protein
MGLSRGIDSVAFAAGCMGPDNLPFAASFLIHICMPNMAIPSWIRFIKYFETGVLVSNNGNIPNSIQELPHASNRDSRDKRLRGQTPAHDGAGP